MQTWGQEIASQAKFQPTPSLGDHVTSIQKKFIYVSAGLLLMIGFQNCSKGFESADLASSNSSFSSSTDTGLPGTGSTTTTTTSTTTTTIVIPPPPGGGGSIIPPADPGDAGRTILKVCASGCPYTLPSQAAAAAQDTNIIEVAAGAYNDCFTLSKNGIKLRGVNGRAHLTGKTCAGKGEIVVAGKDTVIENFEFSGMAVADQNGSGIRHQGIGLIVRNCYFHDGEEGLLSNETLDANKNNLPNDTILVENSKFEHLGAGGQAHAIYLGAHTQVTVRNSMFLASRDEGHEFKSRARNLQIECSYMASLDGVDSYSLNFPDAGAVTVKNTVVEQGNDSANSGIIDYGSEMKHNHPVNTLSFDGLTVINDKDRGTFFAVKNSTEFKIMNSNIVGPGTMYSSQTAVESGLVKTASRSSAGFAAYPALPKPSGCTGTIGLSN